MENFHPTEEEIEAMEAEAQAQWQAQYEAECEAQYQWECQQQADEQYYYECQWPQY